MNELKQKIADALYEQVNYNEKKEIVSRWKSGILAGRVISVLENVTIRELIDIFTDGLVKEEEYG